MTDEIIDILIPRYWSCYNHVADATGIVAAMMMRGTRARQSRHTLKGRGIHKGREVENGKAPKGMKLQNRLKDPAKYAGKHPGRRGRAIKDSGDIPPVLQVIPD